MKGQEIINQLTQEKMPDIQQVRELCLNQPARAKKGIRHLRLSTAAAIVAAFLVFATAAYAVVDYRRVETGGNMDIVILPDNQYGRQLYHERNENRQIGRNIYWALSDNMYIGRITGAMAQFINGELTGQIFTAEGTPLDFELAVPRPGLLSFGNHHLDDRGYVLYNADGYEISSMVLFTDRDGEPSFIHINTRAHEEAVHGHNSTYEEVTTAFGRPVRLPTVHMENFQPPEFNLNNWQPYSREPEWHVRILYTVSELTGIFDFCRNEMRIFIQSERGENDQPLWTLYYLGGEVISHDIAGVIVYELNLPETTTYFVWTHDGLAYNFTPSPMFTNQQTMDVIRSMIE